MRTTTIVSQSTPIGNSAISIVRISGPDTFVFSKRLSHYASSFNHMRAQYLPIFVKNNEKLDSAIYLPFFSPKSYTGEDVMEISCHGNPNIVLTVINEILSFGAVLAEPGEYTKRAYLNGKIDLLQAESVALLIESKSVEAVYQLSKNIGGVTSRKLSGIKKEIVQVLSTIEYELDVSEDDSYIRSQQNIMRTVLKRIIKKIKGAISSFDAVSTHTKGLKVVFAGKPNVGKSTLVNTLLEENKIITSSTPGTTRDIISTDTKINGLPFSFVDTAGLHKTKNEIEAAGIEKTKEEIQSADLIISVFCPGTEPADFIKDIDTIYVHNKTDLKKYLGEQKGVLSVSAATGKGVALLKAKIASKYSTLKQDGSLPLITTLRQKNCLTETLSFVVASFELLEQKSPPLEIIAQELSLAISQLDITTGKTTTNDILDSVFSSFCVGK